PDRESARARLVAALQETAVLGPTTNVAFLLDVLAHPAFVRGDTHTGFLAEHLPAWRPAEAEAAPAAIAAAIAGGAAGSLSDGMQRLADDGRAATMEIGGAWWMDVDDPRAHALAEQLAPRHLAEWFAGAG
ncbi:MAG TPA: hypothetical protein VI199_05350, partial [Novosphingobium sp.]